MKDKDTFFLKKYTLQIGGKIVDLSTPRIMGILNVTPDSFYDGNKYTNQKKILEKVTQMINEGVDFIDVGAVSSRPGAKPVPADEELSRLGMALEVIRDHFPDIILSVDTCRSEIAEFAIRNFKAGIINDISAGSADEKMFEIVAASGIPYIMMHMKGNPQIMQKNPVYDNVTKEIIGFFSEKLTQARLAGINDIIIDPGFGFGKTIQHNYTLLNQLDVFKILEIPVMVGISRKSMIYKVLEITPEESLNGTTILNTLALINGADILRVHDVREAKEAIRLTQFWLKATNR